MYANLIWAGRAVLYAIAGAAVLTAVFSVVAAPIMALWHRSLGWGRCLQICVWSFWRASLLTFVLMGIVELLPSPFRERVGGVAQSAIILTLLLLGLLFCANDLTEALATKCGDKVAASPERDHA